MGLLVEVGLEMEQREGQRWDIGGRTTRGGAGPEVKEQRRPGARAAAEATESTRATEAAARRQHLPGGRSRREEDEGTWLLWRLGEKEVGTSTIRSSLFVSPS
jgi:hypothetical protein